jgi:hypothetical protein
VAQLASLGMEPLPAGTGPRRAWPGGVRLRHLPGRSRAGRQEIREGRTAFETQMLRAGATALDGTAPTAVVAGELLTLTAAWP